MNAAAPTATTNAIAAPAPTPIEAISTGVSGLDEVLGGGLPAHRTYLLRGGPGSGKTTLALQLLVAGAAAGETVLYVTLGAPAHDVRADAAGVGLALDDVAVLDLSPSSALASDDDIAELLAGDVGHHPTMAQAILSAAEERRPQRVVIDSMTQVRERVEDAGEFRRHTLALTRALTGLPATVVFTSEHTEREPDDDLRFLADGVIELEAGVDTAHRVTVTKLRGSGFRRGRHTLRIDEHGVRVHPRLLPDAHQRRFTAQQLPFGVPELDELLCGGLQRGTTTVISGPSARVEQLVGTCGGRNRGVAREIGVVNM